MRKNKEADQKNSQKRWLHENTMNTRTHIFLLLSLAFFYSMQTVLVVVFWELGGGGVGGEREKGWGRVWLLRPSICNSGIKFCVFFMCICMYLVMFNNSCKCT